MEQKKEKASLPETKFGSKVFQKSWMYAGLFAVLAVIVFSKFIFSDSMLYCSDQLGGLDSRVFFHNTVIEHHQFPFWMNSRLGGMPTIDALFGDAFYPLSILINAFVPVHRAIGLKMVLHVFLAGFFFFLMLRKGFKMPAALSFVGGVFYMFNPEFFSHIYPGHDGKMYVIAWLPFMIWRLKSLADDTTFLNATLLGLGVGMSLLTSHVQMTYFVLWGLFFYALFFAVRSFMQKEGPRAIRFGVYFWVGIAIGLAIGFIQLFPSLMYVRDAFSVRGVDRGFEYASSWSLHWPEFFSLWVPEFGNTLDYYWGGNPFKLNSEYAGGLVLMFSVLAVAWKSRPWRWFWIGVIAFSALFSLGAHTPVFYIAYYILPGVKKFRACSMIMFWFSFGTILLSMLFLKDMISAEFIGYADGTRKKRTKALLITIAAFFGIALLFSMKDVVSGLLPFVAGLDTQKRPVFEANFSRNFVPMLWLWFFFSAVALGLVIAVLNKKTKPAAAIAVIAVLGFIDVVRVDAQFIKVIDPRPYFYTEPILEKLRSEMAATGPFRCFSLPGALVQNGEGIHGLEGVSGFHDNELRWYREWRGDQQDKNYFDKLLGASPNGELYLKADQIDKGNPFLDIANVRYLLARNGNDLIAMENKNALGRVSFMPNYVVMDSSRIISALLNGGYDYRTTVALISSPAAKPAENIPDSVALKLAPLNARWEKYTPNDRKVRVTVPANGFLRIAEVFYPGWSIFIDGKPAVILRADQAWMAVNISAGEHVVEMKVKSLFFGKAMLITFPVILFLLIFWSVAALRGNKVRAGKPLSATTV